MPNPLTGDFDAVVQLAVSQVDGLLATLHQYGADAGARLKLMHGGLLAIGYDRVRPELAGVAEWATVAMRGPRGETRPPEDLVAGAPPGIAQRLADAIGNLDGLLDATPDPLRGTAAIQISTLRVTFPPGATDTVTIHARIRARYTPEPGTAAVGAPIHGDVKATFTVRSRVTSGVRRLEIAPTTDDAGITFVPDAGTSLSGSDASAIAVALRRTIRTGITLLPIELPETVPFSAFRAIGDGPSQVIALPLSLSPSATAGDVGSLTEPLVDGHGFAIALSADYIRSLIDLPAIATAVSRRPFTIRRSRFGVSVSVTYSLRFTDGPTLDFGSDVIAIAGRVVAETSTFWAPNGFVTFRQRLALVLDELSPTISLRMVESPTVDEPWFIPHASAVDAVESALAQALDDADPHISRIFRDAREQVLDGLQRFAPTATVSFAAVNVSVHGVVMRGAISSVATMAPVVRVTESDAGRTLSALESWIPGGTIDRFVWSWVDYPMDQPTIVSGQKRSVTHAHQFDLPRPPGLGSASQICLQIEGTCLLPNGTVVPVVAGTTCEVPEPELALPIPSWWEPLVLPVWRPNLAPDTRLSDAVVAHVSVVSDRVSDEPARNTLVSFVDSASPSEVGRMSETLAAMTQPRGALSLLLVVPSGTLTTVRELEARLARLAALTSAPAQVVEDHDGAWMRTFGVTAYPAWFLVDTRREVSWAWTPPEPGEPATLAAALDARMLPAPGPRRRSLPLHVVPGQPAPDVVVDDVRGAPFSLHRHRGRPVVLVFWQAWSEPSLEELRRVQANRDAVRGEAAPVVIGILGSRVDDIDTLGRRLSLTVPIVADFEHRVARRFGVRVWPTVVYVDASGRVERVEMGSRRRDILGGQRDEAAEGMAAG